MNHMETNLQNLKCISPSKLPKERIFGIHGGGNIGLGCMADIVSRSPFRYQIIATSSDKFTNALINSTHHFWLRHGPEKNNEATCIKNITMIDSKDRHNIVNLYCYVDLLALCLTEKAFLNVVKDISLGLLTRYKNNNKALKVLVLMNKPNCEKFIKREINKAILAITGKQSFADKVLKSIQFIPTVADRIVNKIDKELVLRQLKKQLIMVSNQQFSNLNDVFDLDCFFREQTETILATRKNY